MQISKSDWQNYVKKLRQLSNKAADTVEKYVALNGIDDSDALIETVYNIVTKYGEGSSALACDMYDAIAQATGAMVEAAEPAATASYAEVAKNVNGTKFSNLLLKQAADRMVKLAAIDTTVKNAIRDGAEWAWVPQGGSCAFCITLASNGWQRASKKILKGNHAQHIHANCDCQFVVRFDGESGVEDYDPEVYKRMYDEAEGSNPEQKIKSLRRALAEKRTLIKNEPSDTIQTRIREGKYSLKQSHQEYLKHVEGTKQFEQYFESRKNKGKDSQSILTISEDDAQKLIERYAGKGTPKITNGGEVDNKEFVTTDQIIGKYVTSEGEWRDTRRMEIFYGENGSHIVPVKEDYHG